MSRFSQTLDNFIIKVRLLSLLNVPILFKSTSCALTSRWLRTSKTSCLSCSWRSLAFSESNSGIPRTLIPSGIGSTSGGSFGGGLLTLNLTFSHSSITAFLISETSFSSDLKLCPFSDFNSLSCILHSVNLASSLDWTHLLQSRSALLPYSLIPSMATCDKNVVCSQIYFHGWNIWT